MGISGSSSYDPDRRIQDHLGWQQFLASSEEWRSHHALHHSAQQTSVRCGQEFASLQHLQWKIFSEGYLHSRIDNLKKQCCQTPATRLEPRFHRCPLVAAPRSRLFPATPIAGPGGGLHRWPPTPGSVDSRLGGPRMALRLSLEEPFLGIAVGEILLKQFSQLLQCSRSWTWKPWWHSKREGFDMETFG